MSTLINASIKASELKKIDKTKIIKGEKDSYIPVTISVNDESKYGKNVSISIAQSKEERDAKAVKHFLGNGSVIWTDGNILLGYVTSRIYQNWIKTFFQKLHNNACHLLVFLLFFPYCI